jgi:hypothetical protein
MSMRRVLVAVAFCVLFTGSLQAITVAGADPNDPMYLAPAGGAWDGVARLSLTFGGSTFGCSGALLATGLHVLTAGHCVTDFFGAPLPDMATATFITPSGTTVIAAFAYHVFPGWDGGAFSGTDIAIIELAALAPADATRYDIYTDMDEVGQVGNLAGFGLSGTGATGATLGFGTRRQGLNRYDADGSVFGFPGGANMLLGDFDSGAAANDAFGFAIPALANLGEGDNEVDIAPGDSGGPTFLGGKIAGVHSLILAFSDPAGGTLCPPDVFTPANLLGAAGCKLDASFGELFADTRVSSYTGFITSIVPEPGFVAVLAVGLSGLFLLSRRRKTA